MKRLLLFCAALVLFCGSAASAALTYGAAYYQNRIVMSGTGYDDDPIYLFMNEVETEIEASTLEGGTTLTFSTNGGTFDNATNNTFRWGELSEYLTLTFSENATAWSSSTGVVLMDFALVVPKSDQFLFDPVTDPVGSVEGTVYYDSDDDNLYVRTTAGLVDLTAGAGSVTDLDTAYNGGNTIDVDGSAVTLTVSDTDNNVALIVAQNDSTNDPTAMQITSAADAANAIALDIDAQSTGRDIEGTGATWYVSGAGAATFASASVTTLYQTAIVSASAGNVNLTIDAAGSGTITLGGTSTGKITTDNLVEMFGGVDIGDGATDTLTITGIIDSDVTLDDGVTHSPTLTLQDATNETVTIQKQDGGDVHVTVAASEDVEIVTGNLAVGNGSPGTAAMDGEDFYVNGDSEFDGAVQFDGAITAASTTTMSGDVAINDQMAISFNANDEEFAITGTATNMTASAMMTLTMAAQDSGKYILTLAQTPDADADNDFISCADNAGANVKFAVNQGGSTAWTLDAASGIAIDADTTNSTLNTGVLDIEFGSATTGGEAVNIKAISEVAIGETTAAITIDLDDDTAAAASIYGIDIAASDTTGSSTLYGLNIANSIETHINSAVPAAGLFLVLDAASAVNTGTNGVLDLSYQTATNGAEFINIDSGIGDLGDSEIVSVIYVDMDDDDTSAGAADSLYYGLHVNGSDLTGNSTVTGVYIESADAAFQADKGYVRIGTGSTPDVTPSDDDLFVEGTVEVDGAARFDGAITANSTITGDGGDALGGFLKTITDDTDGKTLTVAESGTVQTNAGAGGAAAWTLPTAAAGLEYRFVVMAAQELRVTPAAGDNIIYGSTAMAAAEYYYANAVGESLHIIAVDAQNWIVQSSTGTWTEETP